MAYEIFPLPRDFFCAVDLVCWGRKVVFEILVFDMTFVVQFLLQVGQMPSLF